MSPHICNVHISEVEIPSAKRGQTVTGAITVTTFPSSINSSRALWHISLTCASGIGRHSRNCAIALDHLVSLEAVAIHEKGNLLVQVTHIVSRPSLGARTLARP